MGVSMAKTVFATELHYGYLRIQGFYSLGHARDKTMDTTQPLRIHFSSAFFSF